MNLKKKNPNSGDHVTLEGTDETGYNVSIQGESDGKLVNFRLMSWHRAIALYNILASDVDSFYTEIYMDLEGEYVTN